MSKNSNSFDWNDTIHKLFEMEQSAEDKVNESKCMYCDTSKYKDNYWGEADFDLELELADGDWTHLFMLWNSKTNKFGIYASGEGEAVTDICFCPKCGRKLCQ